MVKNSNGEDTPRLVAVYAHTEAVLIPSVHCLLSTDICSVHMYAEFADDYRRLLAICNEGPVKTYSYHRLKVLEYKYNFHKLLNDLREQDATQVCSCTCTHTHSPSRPLHTHLIHVHSVACAPYQDDPQDFTKTIKVDNHVHLSSAMTKKHLLSFIKSKLTQHSDVR